MKLHCVAHTEQNRRITALLAQACTARSVDIVIHDVDTFNYLADHGVRPGDALYRVAVDSWPNWSARAVEQALLTPHVATFYRQSIAPPLFQANIFQILEKAGLPLPTTIPHVSRDRRLLKEYVAALGGFPIVLKIQGSSRGVGVMKVDSFASLISVVDYLHAQGSQIVMRQFIDTHFSGRLVVVGNEVVASIEFESEPDDFRSNSGKMKRSRARKFSADIEMLAVRAVACRDIEFGGVDILFDSTGAPYIAEVNFPCRFNRAQTLTGVDVAGAMVEHLRHKAASHAVTPAWQLAVS